MSNDASIDIVRDERGVAWLTLNRPQVRNAFDDRLVAELHSAAGELSADPEVRVVVLSGAGAVFSAGADLGWMRSMRTASYDDNIADATRMAAMFRALHELPKPLIGRINGPARGGGAGLVSACDIAIAVREATFAFPEVRLGLAPAVIAPYVIGKLGASFARSVFLTGERFDAPRAHEVGLVHELVGDAAALDTAVDATVARCLQAGPQAVAETKRLMDLLQGPREEVDTDTVGLIAGLRVGEEAQEGMTAFLERRAPRWSPEA